MNTPSFEGSKLSSPQEELDRIREKALTHAENTAEQGIEATPRQIIKETVNSYSGTDKEKLLHPDYALKDQEAQSITLELSPEPHDKQIEELISIMLAKGIKNAMHVAEKMNNPHIMDDFHRFLVQFVASGYNIPDLSNKNELWKPLHMALYEVSLPQTTETDKPKPLSELISGMEQLYSGLLTITSDQKDAGYFSVEIANSNGSEEFIFYVSVPSKYRELFEKQALAIFPGCTVSLHRDDYNVFNPAGVSVASYAKQGKNFLYPLKPYEEYDVDPLSAILNSFSKIDKDGAGASLQFIIGARQDHLVNQGNKALERIRKGMKVKDALEEIDQSIGGAFVKEVFNMFKGEKKQEKEKKDKSENTQSIDQAVIEQFTRKLSSPFISVNIRITASAGTRRSGWYWGDIQSSFHQFEHGHGNRIEWQKVEKSRLEDVLREFTLRTFDERQGLVLNIEELTTVMHFPASNVSRSAPQLRQSKSGTAPAPLDMSSTGTLIGRNKHRGESKDIYISPEDRMRHFYVIGQTGTGKTSLLKNMIKQDILAGHGVCFIDPHGSDVMDILASIPKERYEDVIYFDPASTDRPMALNMLEYDRRFPEQKTFVVNEMFSIFQKLYGAVPESMGPMFEQYFRNATNLVIEDPDSGSTLLDVSRVMSNKAFRDMKIANCKNPVVVQFWKEIAEKAGGEASLANIVPYITSKFDVFLANEIMRPIIAQEKSSFNMREVMDSKKILLVNLSKGRLGDINSHLIGLILVGKILMSALSRVDSFGKGVGAMPDFYLYLDEFQNITTDSIATILSEARKYRLGLTVAHQFIGQLDDKIKNAVFGNVGSMAVFRVGTEDAEIFEKQFMPVFTKNDIINIDNFNACVRILSGGRPTKPFNIELVPPVAGNIEQVGRLKELSSLLYGRLRMEVEDEIMEKYKGMKV